MDFMIEKDKPHPPAAPPQQLRQQQQHPQQQHHNDGNHKNVRGPIFISIGTVEQLQVFLTHNPKIPRQHILVDNYQHTVYKETMGFSRVNDNNIATIGPQLLAGRRPILSKLLVPLVRTLGLGTLLDYVQTVPVLAPLPTGTKMDWTNLPESGLRNGGTIVVQGQRRQRRRRRDESTREGEEEDDDDDDDDADDTVLYRWNDQIPGDVPTPQDVYDIAVAASVVDTI